MKSVFTCLLQLLSIIVLMGQPIDRMSYQAVIRDQSQQLVGERSIGIRVSILQGSETGIVVFQETYNPNPTSNQNGLITLEIGDGVAITGKFEEIDWTVGPFFLKTEYDLDGGISYSIDGTMQILSVPYSLYAKKAGKVDHLQLGDIEGVDVLGAQPGQVLKWDGFEWKPSTDISNGGTADNWGSQYVETEIDVVSNTGDGDETNELQTLSISGNVLSLSDQGGSVTIPSDLNGSDNYIVKFDGQLKGMNSVIRESDVGNVSIGVAPYQFSKFRVDNTGGGSAIFANSIYTGVEILSESGSAIVATSEQGITSIVAYNDNNSFTAVGGDIQMDGGSLYTGSIVPSYKIHLATNSAAKPTSSSWTVASDARLKKDVSNYTQGLDDILKIRPVQFTYTGEAGLPEETGVGVLAQELQAIAPFMVHNWTYRENREAEGTEYLAVDNGAMTYMLINAVKELYAEIENLKLENQELRKAK